MNSNWVWNLVKARLIYNYKIKMFVIVFFKKQPEEGKPRKTKATALLVLYFLRLLFDHCLR